MLLTCTRVAYTPKTSVVFLIARRPAYYKRDFRKSYLISRTQRGGMSSLEKFLEQQKHDYLRAVESGRGKEWTVAMGNEAGGIQSLFMRELITHRPHTPRSRLARFCDRTCMVQKYRREYTYGVSDADPPNRPPSPRGEPIRHEIGRVRSVQSSHPLHRRCPIRIPISVE